MGASSRRIFTLFSAAGCWCIYYIYVSATLFFIYYTIFHAFWYYTSLIIYVYTLSDYKSGSCLKTPSLCQHIWDAYIRVHFDRNFNLLYSMLWCITIFSFQYVLSFFSADILIDLIFGLDDRHMILVCQSLTQDVTNDSLPNQNKLCLCLYKIYGTGCTLDYGTFIY